MVDSTTVEQYRSASALSYYIDLTLSQEFQPMAAQLSMKAALPLVKLHVAVIRQGPVVAGGHSRHVALCTSVSDVQGVLQ